MFSRIVLFLALSVQACIALAAENPVLKNWQKHLDNQNAYHQNTQKAAAEVRASISMTEDKKTRVKQMLERSGVLEDGSKVKIGASVTRSVDTAKAAKAIVDRLANAKDYAKKLGRASIPSFVGMAAFEGLMKGVDYVMDEGGKVTKKNEEQNPALYKYYSVISSKDYKYYHSNTLSGTQFCKIAMPGIGEIFGGVNESYRICYGSTTGKYVYEINKVNPLYQSNVEHPDRIEVNNDELQAALKKALESNNTALAAAIAEALKAAYIQDNSEGQPGTTNPLIAEIGDDMQRAVDSAFDNPQPNPKNPERPDGYYKITDGDKTIEGYVRPSDTTGSGTSDSITTPNPDGSSTTTGTSTQQLPAFCDWAGIVCDWIGWTKEDPEADENLEQPQKPSDQGIFDKKFDFKFEFGGSCPPDYVFTWETKPFDGQHTFDLSWLCKIFTFLGYPLVFLSHCIGFWIFYEAAIRKEFKF